jgi:hypothetical protein
VFDSRTLFIFIIQNDSASSEVINGVATNYKWDQTEQDVCMWLRCVLSFCSETSLLTLALFYNVNGSIRKAVPWRKVSRRPLIAEARVRARVSPCRICGRQSGTGTGFFPISSVFPCQYQCFSILTDHLGGRTIGPLVTAVQRYGLTPST